MLEFSPLCLNRLDKSDILSSVIHYVDSIHLDIMDGIFVPNKAFTSKEINEFKCSVPKHVHIMSEDPLPYIDELLDVDSISVHFEIESCSKAINRILQKKFKVGLVVNPSTPIESIYKYLPEIDRVILMAVEPGYSAQDYLPDTTKKLIKLRQYSKDIEIVIDGGMNENTIKLVKEFGANCFVVCSVIAKSKNVEEKAKQLKKIWNS